MKQNLIKAIEIGETIGQTQGWAVFSTDRGWQVQKIDDAGILASDDEAIALAKIAGIAMNDDGYIVDNQGEIIASDEGGIHMKMVEYFRLWEGGTWNTHFIDIPADTPDDMLDEAVRDAAAKLDWGGAEPPVIVGHYHSNDYDPLNALYEQLDRTSHATDCPARHSGECLCERAEIIQEIIDLGGEDKSCL